MSFWEYLFRTGIYFNLFYWGYLKAKNKVNFLIIPWVLIPYSILVIYIYYKMRGD